MNPLQRWGLLALLATFTFVQRSEGAIQLISNGNFETGSFSGWTHSNQTGGNGDWLIDNPGTSTPISGHSTLATGANGNSYAVSDQVGSGAHVLLHNFFVPANATNLTLSFQMFANDYSSGPSVNPAGLTIFSGANQQARVDILYFFGDPFSTALGGVAASFFVGADAGADPHAFTNYSFSFSLAPSNYVLRFAEVDTGGFFNMGVDNVSILAESTSVPEPASLAVWSLIAGMFGVGSLRKRLMRTAAVGSNPES